MNIRGSVRFTKFESTRGLKSRLAKLKADQVIEIYHSTLRTDELAKKFFVSKATILKIKRRKSYRDVDVNEGKT